MGPAQASHSGKEGKTSEILELLGEMKSEGLIELLEQQIARLKKNKGDEVAGFFFVLAPEQTEAIANMFFGTGPSRIAFFKYLSDQLGEATKAQTDPYIGIGGGRR